MPRIYFGNLPSDIGPNDLGALIGKICPAKDIYIPGKTPTGIHRRFAVAVVDADDATLEKCIRVLNNCFWKDTKLRVEKAKEYYQDRLDKERKQLEQSPVSTNDINSFPTSINHLKSVSGPISLITKRTTRKSGECNNFYIKVRPRGKKIKFSDEGSFSNVNILDADKGLLTEDMGNFPIMSNSKLSKNNTSNMVPGNIPSSHQDNNDISITTTAAAVITTTAPKKRLGFGSVTVSNIPTAVAGTIIDSNHQNKRNTGGTPTVDCCIDSKAVVTAPPLSRNENPNILRRLEEGEEGAGDQPSVSPSEITTTALKAERLRALSIIGQVISTTTTTTATPLTEVSQKKQKNRINKLETNHSEKSEETSIVQNDSNVLDRNKQNEVISMDLESKKSSTTASSSSSDLSIVAISNDNKNTTFANTTVLKDIFYREGGLRWGDDGTLKQIVAINEDILSNTLFLEAEKHGIDARPWTAGDKSMEEKTLLFNFFDDTPTSTTATVTTTNNSNSNIDANISVNSLSQNSSNINTIISDKKRKINEDSNEESEISNTRKIKRDVTAPSQCLPYMTSGEIAHLAFLFCRVDNSEKLTKIWKESDTRLKLTVDYKRKRKDARKKALLYGSHSSQLSGKWSSTNTPFISGNKHDYHDKNAGGMPKNQTLSMGRKPATGGSVSYQPKRRRGGIKHKKKS